MDSLTAFIQLLRCVDLDPINGNHLFLRGVLRARRTEAAFQTEGLAKRAQSELLKWLNPHEGRDEMCFSNQELLSDGWPMRHEGVM